MIIKTSKRKRNAVTEETAGTGGKAGTAGTGPNKRKSIKIIKSLSGAAGAPKKQVEDDDDDLLYSSNSDNDNDDDHSSVADVDFGNAKKTKKTRRYDGINNVKQSIKINNENSSRSTNEDGCKTHNDYDSDGGDGGNIDNDDNDNDDDGNVDNDDDNDGNDDNDDNYNNDDNDDNDDNVDTDDDNVDNDDDNDDDNDGNDDNDDNYNNDDNDDNEDADNDDDDDDDNEDADNDDDNNNEDNVGRGSLSNAAIYNQDSVLIKEEEVQPSSTAETEMGQKSLSTLPAAAAAAVNNRVNGLLDLSMTFAEFGAREYLDSRITRAIVESMNLTHPTLIQTAAIPLILQGKDVLARARTGSGKTLAYAIPMIQKTLEIVEADSAKSTAPLQGCVLLPSRELCTQVTNVFTQLCEYCSTCVSVKNLVESLKKLGGVETPPTIIISTPKSLLVYLLKKGVIDTGATMISTANANSSFWRTRAVKKTLKSTFQANLKLVVLDEADAMTSLGFMEDLNKLFNEILSLRTVEHRFQAILCSATLNAEVDHLKTLVLHNPAIVKLEEGFNNSSSLNNVGNYLLFSNSPNGPLANNLAEFYTKCTWKDKYLVLYSLLKLQLIPMKCLIFTSSAEKAYALRLFLERFSIRASVLCPLLPFSSRINILQSFNQSLFELLIATDEFFEKEKDEQLVKAEASTEVPIKKESNSSDDEDEEEALQRVSRSKKAKFKKDYSYGVHRGMDLKGVKCVINYDMPKTRKAYIHRVGRTARAGASGIALTLCSTTDAREVSMLDKLLTSRCSPKAPGQSALQPLAFDIADVGCFRYRVEDVLRTVTPRATAEVRKQELHREILHTKKLKEHFEANPADANALSKAFRTQRTNSGSYRHLQKVPGYLEPRVAAISTTFNPVQAAVRQVQQEYDEQQQQQMSGSDGYKTSNPPMNKRRRTDPLKDFVGTRKKYTVGQLLAKNLSREPDYSMTAPENLPALSRTKLRKTLKGKLLKKPERLPHQMRRRYRFVRRGK